MPVRSLSIEVDHKFSCVSGYARELTTAAQSPQGPSLTLFCVSKVPHLQRNVECEVPRPGHGLLPAVGC